MTETQKRWLATAVVMLWGILVATDFHPARISTLPLWSWIVLLLMASLVNVSWLWIRPEQRPTNKLRFGLAWGSYFGVYMFLLRLVQDASQSAPAWGNAVFMGLFGGIFMGLGMGFRPQLFQRSSHGS